MQRLFLSIIIFIGGYMFAASLPSSDRAESAVKDQTAKLTLQLNAKGFELGASIYIRIFKESSELEVWMQKDETFELFKTYPICYFSGNLGPKLKQGDKQSPEGFYFVPPNMMNPNSRFHLSFNLGYPNKYDRYHGRTGDFLMVHGDCVSIGCYAMTDELIEEIYTLAHAAFQNGQPFFRVHAFPFRMTEENMQRHKDNDWFDFWQNLQEGYDLFESNKKPPNVEVSGGKYVFDES